MADPLIVDAMAVDRLAGQDRALYRAVEDALRACGYRYHINSDQWIKERET